MPSSRVAVIGEGAAGLVATRELRREGHAAVVFERAVAVGGTWLYDEAASADPLGAGGVHGSLHASLRTNLPHECMGFLDFPFLADEGSSSSDPRRFPGHQEVLRVDINLSVSTLDFLLYFLDPHKDGHMHDGYLHADRLSTETC
ncbi:putative flavin-containing monooxygenase FMO GS-OX-like 11 [Aegilops tauschii subsp. strangulata]|uniref:putative flavin-containing monooxygenase FMO GS-OX-like 11 n=1 Tax=Aegilops tauschii subsp. strangulata TaxID=200361 RepID=UPI000989F994|nr:putative flavin-containing monooxygenase FMO GS-OX-like 11 [Aegilops tauschii subsp. strangulata]